LPGLRGDSGPPGLDGPLVRSLTNLKLPIKTQIIKKSFCFPAYHI
jgi:hypothetical protein